MNLEGKINLIKESVTAIKQAIIGKNVTPSGNVSTYADAINNIVTPNNQTKTVTSNGVVRYDIGYTGLEQVTVNVQPNLNTKTITVNGTYNASSDNLDGYSSVTVNISNPIDDLLDGSITSIETNVSDIKNSAFKDCEDLDTVILRSNTVVDLSDITIFENTPIVNRTGNIYVPDVLINEYLTLNSTLTPATQNTALGENYWRALAYDGTKFVALGSQGYISTSTDGINWTMAVKDTKLGTASDWQSLAYDGTKFVALNSNGYISTSTDGTTWITWMSITNLGSKFWRALAYDGTKFVALGSQGYISTSTDGTTWTTANAPNELHPNGWSYVTDGWNTLAYDGTKFVALGESGYISTSTDGINWTTAVQNTDLGSHDWEAIAYDSTKFIALGYQGYISTSTDGTTWTVATQNTNLGTNQWVAIVYGTRLVGLGNKGHISLNCNYNILPISQLS